MEARPGDHHLRAAVARVNEQQPLFLVQARTDLVVFELLAGQELLPPCHALHYLQMATEMFGKAYSWKNGPNYSTHRAFVGFLRSLPYSRAAQKRCGYEGKNEGWMSLIRHLSPIALRIEDLAPSLAGDGPNPEYPWPRHSPSSAPAEHEFELWTELRFTSDGRQFRKMLGMLLGSAEAYL
jgi:hypothetical protein